MRKVKMLVVGGILSAAIPMTANGIGTDYTWRYVFVGAGDSVEIQGYYLTNGNYYPAASPTPTGAVNIPSYIDGYPVTSIGELAFYRCSGLTHVTIPGSVTNIGANAFHGCSGLMGLTIPNRVASIGFQAFRECTGLTHLTIPDSVRSIGDWSFTSCSGLTGTLAIPNSVTYIGAGAFECCSGVTSVTIPEGLASIGYAVFDRTGLTHVTIPNSVTSIGDHAFSSCRGLRSITIPDSVTSIGKWAFSADGNSLTSLTNVTIGSSVRSIGDYAFRDCQGLTNVSIPDSVTSIGYSAFYCCINLKSVVIGTGKPYIGGSAFCTCTNLTSVTFLGDVHWETKSNIYSGTPVDLVTYVTPAWTQSTSWWGDRAVKVVSYATAAIAGKRESSFRAWLAPSILERAENDLFKAAEFVAANRKLSVAECYALGIDPEDPDDDLKITDFEIESGKPIITLNHTADGSGNSFISRVKTLGKTNIGDALEKWRVVPEGGDSAMRFFKVDVDLP